MAVRITAVHLSQGGYLNEHITDVKWTSYDDGSTGQSTKADMVKFIDVDHGKAYVESSTSKVEVGVVKPQGGTPYLRTFANGEWTDNLLSLPRF